MVHEPPWKELDRNTYKQPAGTKRILRNSFKGGTMKKQIHLQIAPDAFPNKIIAIFGSDFVANLAIFFSDIRKDTL